MSKSMTQAERITALETEVTFFRHELREMKIDTTKKLDELLALRNKGAGAFWLASVIFGTFLLGVGSIAVSWFKGA